ncbi:MAG: hypothetical protein ABJ327_14955 [Litoreibacter sp.]
MPYQIVGGLAARAHGASRPLYDIDLYMPFSNPRWRDFLEDIDPYVVWGPKAVVEGAWDLTYLKANYHGQKIEIGDTADLKIQSSMTGEWVKQVIDFETSIAKSLLDCEIKVMPVDQLIAYKRLLGRDVDQQDVRELTFIYS